MPVPVTDLVQYLAKRLPAAIAPGDFVEVCRRMAIELYHQTFPLHQKLEGAYAALDPDRDTSLLTTRNEEELLEDAAQVSDMMRDLLATADYAELSREELDAAVQVASLWGVPLHVDLNIFRHLAVFARGDVVGMREHRHWKRLYRKQLVEVPIYRRLVVLFQVLPDIAVDGEGESNRLYLRMFKNIPKADVDMLLPGTSIRIGWFDRTKILVPSLSGIGMTLWKLVRLVLLVAVVTTGKLWVVVGLIGATVGYVFRSISSYFHTKKNYELNLTRSLYFQKLDSNAGVIYRVLEEARQQACRETVLGYFALLTASMVPNAMETHELSVADANVWRSMGVSRRRMRRYGERIIREALGVEINFEVDDALGRLEQMGLSQATGEDCWKALPPEAALARLASRVTA